MLKPNKYTDINLSVIGISTEIIFILTKEPLIKYNSLLNKILLKRGKNSIENFLPSLCFLFALGKIVYHPKEDIIELLLAQ